MGRYKDKGPGTPCWRGTGAKFGYDMVINALWLDRQAPEFAELLEQHRRDAMNEGR